MMQCLQNEAEFLSGDARETSRRMGGGDDFVMLLCEKKYIGYSRVDHTRVHTCDSG